MDGVGTALLEWALGIIALFGGAVCTVTWNKANSAENKAGNAEDKSISNAKDIGYLQGRMEKMENKMDEVPGDIKVLKSDIRRMVEMLSRLEGEKLRQQTKSYKHGDDDFEDEG